jgi:outer membrane protein TolC
MIDIHFVRRTNEYSLSARPVRSTAISAGLLLVAAFSSGCQIAGSVSSAPHTIVRIPASETSRPEVVIPAESSPPDTTEAMPEAPTNVSPSEPQSIDLSTALALTAGRSPEVAWAKARIEESRARLSQADALWLPSLRLGMNINHHDGRIQDVAGTVIETSRSSLYGGLGAAAVGAGSPAVPGLQAQFRLSDAVFQPRIQRQTLSARTAAARAASHDSLLATALAWVRLQKAAQHRTLAETALADALELERVTREYAAAGQGLTSDYDRARTETAFRRSELHRAAESALVASAEMARQVRWEYGALLVPADQTPCPLVLVDVSQSAQQLVAAGLANRPEIAESRHLVSEAVQQLQREKWAPLIPSILLGVSYGGLTGGLNGDFKNEGDRLDADAAAWWEIRQFGVGEHSARREMQARITQTRMQQVSLMDQIAREVVEAHARAGERFKRIETSRAAAAAAVESWQKNSERIRNGQGLPLEVLQSLQALNLARRETVEAITDFNEAQFALHRALGWPIEASTLPQPLTPASEPPPVP